MNVVSAGGLTTVIERFFADGNLAFRQTANSDGSVDSTNYERGGSSDAVRGEVCRWLGRSIHLQCVWI